MRSAIAKYFDSYTDAAPLAVFRIGFGIMMLASIIRFWLNGWIEKLYILPEFHFSYYGFEWVKPLGDFTYLLFIICGLAALFVALGYKYRIAIIIFFLSFTYIELMDKTTYLNHYYFISILSFLMIFLPANAYFSIDAWKNLKRSFQKIPRWCIDSIKLLLGIVYFYAGLAKINSDWLFRAMPLKIWLPSKYDLPLVGDFMQQEWVAYAFSWSGMLYDLFIPFLLLWKRTRLFAFLMVIVFHVLTRVLFPIGMFPYIMIVSALIFFSPKVHHKILETISTWFRINRQRFDNSRLLFPNSKARKFLLSVVGAFFVIQLLFPWRYLMYPGELFWTEEGFRFSWRVMLMEKAGFAQFKIVDAETGKGFLVTNSDFLTPFQEKQMSFQPDFILEYAHFLADHFREQGHENIEVYVESYVGLNGRKSVPYISPDVNLLNFADSFERKTFILPFNDEIKGL
ncbi:HTTM domain-containing protein [Gramella lutea]|uniref:HTTM domain-containing protein n=1 Tax=Christiangramia lutea TaxID=1607951 RepID=A0A9X1V5T6_9FLAO|nr:HTTM domain-containing protein [Christiangramia lutea]MCH4823424.1 HTTM domain-containing protein [Christiangramia lutea]